MGMSSTSGLLPQKSRVCLLTSISISMPPSGWDLKPSCNVSGNFFILLNLKGSVFSWEDSFFLGVRSLYAMLLLH